VFFFNTCSCFGLGKRMYDWYIFLVVGQRLPVFAALLGGNDPGAL
jgi:hypothetical protein